MNRTQRRDFFEDKLQNHTNIFMTIHGGPLSYSSQTASENPVGIVPEGCIKQIITPPQAVVKLVLLKIQKLLDLVTQKKLEKIHLLLDHPKLLWSYLKIYSTMD